VAKKYDTAVQATDDNTI